MNAMQTLVALWTLVLKEIKRFTRIWPQTLLPPSITMAMYFIIFGSLIGSRIGEMDGDDVPNLNPHRKIILEKKKLEKEDYIFNKKKDYLNHLWFSKFQSDKFLELPEQIHTN